MADNKTFQSSTPATLPAGTKAATKEVAFSGDTTDVQLIEIVSATGSEGSRTLNEISDASGLKVQDGGNVLSIDDGGGNISIDDGGNSITVDNGGTFAVQESGSALTALQLIDDPVATLGTTTYSEATTKGMIVGAVRRDADTTLVDTTNEVGPLQMNAAGQLKVEAFSGETLPVSLASVPSHAVTNAGTFAVQVDGTALTRLTDIETNTDSNAVVGNGTAATAQRVTLASDSTGIVALTTSTASIGKLAANSGVDIGDVDILSIAAGDNNIGNVDIVTMPNVTLAAGTNTNEVVGDIAHDTGVGGNPVLIAGAAQDMDDTAPPNRVSAESDTTRLATDRDGALFAHPHGPQIWDYHLDTSTAQTDTQVHAATGSASLCLYVTDIVFSSDGTAAINLFFEEGSTKKLGPYYLPATAGGVRISFQTPKKLTANTALTLTTSASHAHSIDITGFVGQG